MVFISSIFGLTILGIAILWYQRLAYTRNVGPRSAIPLAKSMTGWMFVNCVLALFTGPVYLAALISIVTLYRAGERRAFMWTLAVAADKHIPLSEAARSFAQDQHADFSARALEFADAIDAGAPVGVALKQARISLPVAAKLAIQLGDLNDIGLQRTLLDATEHDNSVAVRLSAVVDRILHLFFTLATLIGIVTFTCVYVIPTFRQIFEDFDMELPYITELVIATADAVSRYAWVLVLVCLIIGQIMVYEIIRKCGAPIPAIPWLPSYILRRAYAPTILRSLIHAVQMQIPIHQRLFGIADHFPNRRLARQIRTSAEQAEQGGSWIEGLFQQKFISKSEAGFLQSAESLGNLAWAVQEVADRKADRLVHRTKLVMEWLEPIPTIMLSIPVGVFAVAVVLPCANLVKGLSM